MAGRGAAARAASRGARLRAPTDRLERWLWRQGAGVLVACDEVGRGAWAGPISVGALALVPGAGPAPTEVRDSKLLGASRREALVPALAGWAHGVAVGHAAASEVDREGLLGALRLATLRALAQLPRPDVVLLDGPLDWLGGKAPGRVLAVVAADRRCVSVAGASVVAKVHRDRLMTGLAARYPGYGWDRNKGYGTPEHRSALTRLGPSPLHRRSWRLPSDPGPGTQDALELR
ncbi:ribonuclease HII [Aciditerrimonas ferrireducens]|uniref:ribonuclease HII n=1 Tax=Aciditerrimonas ferrireducens TaxID=667306 RepID=UPI002003D028|nr:ribonuclease HII [Aciditerrimonas ferrireducens]MCK4177877.1 ribonuclease HII [Aciditerrimonas ferrireducens]